MNLTITYKNGSRVVRKVWNAGVDESGYLHFAKKYYESPMDSIGFIDMKEIKSYVIDLEDIEEKNIVTNNFSPDGIFN